MNQYRSPSCSQMWVYPYAGLSHNGNGHNTITDIPGLLTFETNIRYFKRQWPKKIITISLQNTERFPQ